MNSPKLPFMMRLGMTAGLVGLVLWLLGLPVHQQVQADAGAQPALQETDWYYPPYDETLPPEPTLEDGYPFPEETGTPDAIGTETTPLPGVTRTAGPTLTASTTATQTPTVSDLFRTEDAEMNNSLSTQSVTQTPAPTMTRYTTKTPGLPRTARPTLAGKAKKPGGPNMDWGMFWIGVSLPVFAACGLVLYMLDRHPNFFKTKPSR